jgi:hypothetical protein
MTEDEALDLIAKFVNAQWDDWVKAGGLDAVEAVLGPVKTEPARSIFEAGWKLGTEHFMKMGRELSNQMMEKFLRDQ